MNYRTICYKCDKVLTQNGIRYHSANFDDSERPAMTEDMVYAVCDECIEENNNG